MHGSSSIVIHVLVKAAMRGVKFNVIITDAQGTGTIVKKILDENHIPTKYI